MSLSKFDLKLFKSKKDNENEQLRNENRELVQQHEVELQQIQISLKKAEREVGFRDQEMKHYKKMAEELAE